MFLRSCKIRSTITFTQLLTRFCCWPFSRSYSCNAVWSAIGMILASVCLSVCHSLWQRCCG